MRWPCPNPELAKSILAESTELSKAEPEVPFDQFVNLLVRLRTAAGDSLSPQQSQNFSIKTEEFSTANIGDIAANLPGVVARGLPAGLSLPDVGALFSVATGTLNPAEAGTASQNIITRLAAPNPDTQKLFKKLGIPEGSSVTDIIAALGACPSNTLDAYDMMWAVVREDRRGFLRTQG